MSDEFRVVDVWVGQFATPQAFDAYFAETYSDDDDQPISRFAKDQGEAFYDHDLIETSFQPSTDQIESLLSGHSFVESYLPGATAAFQAAGLRSANAVVIVFGKEIAVPVSIDSEEYSLRYLGRFECDPAEPAIAVGDSGPPPAVQLIVEGNPLTFNGSIVTMIPIDSRGLVIGKGTGPTEIPRLDLSHLVPNLADDQVRISQDQFEQWVIEDLGNNGLTRLNQDLLTGRTFPWHGKRLGIGDVWFTWSAPSQARAT